LLLAFNTRAVALKIVLVIDGWIRSLSMQIAASEALTTFQKESGMEQCIYLFSWEPPVVRAAPQNLFVDFSTFAQ
jgi:hypothetical protein